MKYLVRIFLLFVLFNYSCTFTSNNLKVQIEDGKIIGRYMTSTSGKTIRAFMGIPFAAPPVGDLRFKAPKKPKPWLNQTLYAQNEPPMCVQTNILDRTNRNVFGQEDCLYLNVYTPDLSLSEKRCEKLPVMVWIHGGGWVTGHSGHTFYGPEYLMEHDIILVTGNYRLGPLGFLSTEDENCPGNFAFKDHIMVLQWVQENIEKFGGDKNSVTIFGESAGAGSVNYLMHSPIARGLFHRAITQSGGIMNPWADPPNKGVAKSRAIKLARLMNCSTDISTKEIIECLRNVDADKILSAVYDFYEFDYDPAIPFLPVIEDFPSEEEPFITDLDYKKFSLDIPWMTGVTNGEGIFKAIGIVNNETLKTQLINVWKRLIPIAFYYDHLPQQEIDEINSAIYDFYFKDKPIDDNDENIIKMWSDGWFVGGLIENLQERLRNNNRDNTFVYLFNHKGSMSFSEIVGGEPEKYYGTSHFDDNFYLFPMRQYIPYYYSSIPTNEDIELRKIMTKLWVNFATTGKPTPEWSKDSKIPFWSPASHFPLDYMQIGNENGNSDKLLVMKRDLFTERTKLWIKLREKYGLKMWKTSETSRKTEL